ncbi:LysR substrate-binding domain-containing protein [Salinisphaera sp. SPP-AMP-43]|uniref:LysR substrate-binding domain-containing protein n=1 Tax=Salinisphaera sp. SPP-AMP-43 TaxID=3121288 RepID=UPI003C6E2A1C
MDRVAALQTFVRVVEAGGFAAAAEQLGLSRARVSRQIQQLEDHLGARLLHRTTRQVSLSEDGHALLERSRDLLDDLGEIESLFDTERGEIAGRLRVDMSHALARDLVVPRLPELLARHPRLAVELSCSDGPADLVREGLDCVVRVGAVHDSQLIARRLGDLPIINCASPDYLARHGSPATPADLDNGHCVVHYVAHLGNPAPRWEYREHGQTRHLQLPGALTVNSTTAYTEACLAGLGLIQVPRSGVQRLLDEGRLVEVLADYRAEPMPVSLLYPHRRNLSRRVQLFMDWLGEHIRAYYQLA